MKTNFKLIFLIILFVSCYEAFSQKIVEEYKPLKNDSIRIGKGDTDFLPFIKSGYTLMLPKKKTVKGVLVFLEGSEYDKKNRSAKQLYNQADINGFAVLSVSTEVPLDFYFDKSSMLSAEELIKEAFLKHKLPNRNVFFLGTSLVGHRAMQYIKYMKESNADFQLDIKGIVMCNFTLDFTRKWHQHERDIRINKINLWEPKFMNYMLETHLKGTPETAPQHYHDFSSYSYSNLENNNVDLYKNYAIRAYAEPAIHYRLKKYFRTLYENNVTDIVGFLAELNLRGNENTELIILQPEDNPSEMKSTQGTWNAIDKKEMMNWILKQTTDSNDEG
ncbi:hypothetical protein SAMN04489761_2493 [Tenacibaculum sp. MAR_2009_124]|uniref:hypothetical protein n=1 Tax=Tenacibaculum sp. MAR_2009_124 TaxID=1250059 RepID=UPI00089AA908|nr:hypothetical protein [Tenacibaculum sp. MAR_2009_124]SEC25276.1 hypothetical protein SAMN04489761_2493 [Tenacibaculum sp. MAR_2009_124]